MAALGFLKGVGLLSGAHRENAAIGSNSNSNTICLFGHSLGALVAFETARYLKSRFAVEIPYLYLSCLPEPTTICDANRDYLVTKRGELSNDMLLKKMKEMGDSVLNRFCTSDNADNGNESDNNMNKLLQMFIPLLRADFVLLESYVMDSYLQKDDSSTLASGRNGLRQCHLTTLVCEEDSVVIGDDYKGDTAQKKVIGRGIQPKHKSDDEGMQIIEPKKISQEYNDTIEEWSQQLAGGTRGANYRDGCSHSHMSFPKGGHHGYLLRLENQMLLISDVVQKMNSNSSNLVVIGK
jgi:surfactin synthase thioesterase subunit